MNPLFSIVIPIYNVAPYLKDCLQSILRQSFTNFECICIDDGSTDGSEIILNQYANLDSRIIARHQKNKGVGPARNLALQLARGKWVLFVDADDVIHPQTLECVNNHLLRNPELDIVRFEPQKFSFYESLIWADVDFERIGEIVDFSKQLPYCDLAAMLWGAIYRRSLLPTKGFKTYCRGEDRLYVGEFLTQAKRGLRIKDILYGYRIREGSSMCSPMTSQKLYDRLGYSYDWLTVLIKSGRTIPASIIHEIGVNVTEGFVWDVRTLPLEAQEKLYCAWYKFLEKIISYRCFSLWTLFVVWSNKVLRLRFWAYSTCYLPFLLKKKGFHR